MALKLVWDNWETGEGVDSVGMGQLRSRARLWGLHYSPLFCNEKWEMEIVSEYTLDSQSEEVELKWLKGGSLA